MTIAYRRVDAFADRPGTGNPAAVCVVPSFPEEDVMQTAALEMNLSETAFVVRRADGGFDLRWFTPWREVELCGHATLASAHVLFADDLADLAATFHTMSGELRVERLGDGLLAMDFPREDAIPVDPPRDGERALGARVRAWAANRMDLLAEVDSADTLRGIEPDFGAVARLGLRGLVVTAPGGPRRTGDPPGTPDFVSRFFAPAAGIPEDPVTGSAHCALAPWWAGRLGRTRLVGHQLSRRGGAVSVDLRGERVLIAGRALTVGEGKMDLG